MNVILGPMTVMSLPTAMTPRETSLAPASLDMKEMEPAAQVCTLSVASYPGFPRPEFILEPILSPRL